MTIQTFLDPTLLPNRTQDQTTFDNAMAYLMQNLSTWGNEVNGTLGSLNALLAGGAYALPYVFDSSTADADPGVGKLRLSSTTQNAAATVRLDTTSGGADISSMLDTFDASTSAVKGSFKIVKAADLSKFLTFDITARAAPSGYRNFTVTNTGGSSANPFANGDAVLVFFQRNGDAGVAQSAMQLIASADITTTSIIDFLSIFTSAYDKYVIEMSGWNFTSPASLNMFLAVAGAVPTNSSLYYSALVGHGVASSANTNTWATLTTNSIYTSGTESQHGEMTIEIANTNDANAKTINVRGCFVDSANAYVYGVHGTVRARGAAGASPAISGFRLQGSGGTSFTKAKIRVYGIKNSA